jgi:hypothetical protein
MRYQDSSSRQSKGALNNGLGDGGLAIEERVLEVGATLVTGEEGG